MEKVEFGLGDVGVEEGLEELGFWVGGGEGLWGIELVDAGAALGDYVLWEDQGLLLAEELL